MAKKSKMRRSKRAKTIRKKKAGDIKFQLWADSTYGLTEGELRRSARSYGASKKKSRSYARSLRRRK
jgi:hypothetical protein